MAVLLLNLSRCHSTKRPFLCNGITGYEGVMLVSDSCWQHTVIAGKGTRVYEDNTVSKFEKKNGGAMKPLNRWPGWVPELVRLRGEYRRSRKLGDNRELLCTV